MKVAYLALLTVGFASLMLMRGTSFAAPLNPALQQTSPESAANTAIDHPRAAGHAAPADDGNRQKTAKPSDERQDGSHGSENNQVRSPADLTSTNRPKRIPNSREDSTSGNAMKLRRPRAINNGGLAKGGLIKNEKVSDARPVQTLSVARSAAPSLNNVRHRGANPAVIGGSTISDSRNAGAINGTRMNRRP